MTRKSKAKQERFVVGFDGPGNQCVYGARGFLGSEPHEFCDPMSLSKAVRCVGAHKRAWPNDPHNFVIFKLVRVRSKPKSKGGGK